MATAEGVWLEIAFPLDPSPLRSSSVCRLPARLKVAGMASGFWLFYASRFSCFDIFSDMTFDPAEVMLTLFSLGIFYLCTVLLEYCSCLSYFGGALSQRCSLINVRKGESSALFRPPPPPPTTKGDNVSSWQTGKFREKWRNPGGKSALFYPYQGKAAQGMRVTSEGMLCALGNPLLKDFQLIEKVKHPHSC